MFLKYITIILGSHALTIDKSIRLNRNFMSIAENNTLFVNMTLDIIGKLY